MHTTRVLGDVAVTGRRVQTASLDLTEHLAPICLGSTHHPFRLGREPGQIPIRDLTHHIHTNRRRQHPTIIAKGCHTRPLASEGDEAPASCAAEADSGLSAPMEQHRSRFAARAVAVAVSLTLIGGACSSDDPSITTADVETVSAVDRAPVPEDVVSAVATRGREGNATVLTSPTTLAAKVSVPDAALGEVDPAELTADVLSYDDADSSVIAFRLGPDGSEFEQPVSLEWDGQWSPEASFSLTAVHGDGTPVDTTERQDANSIAALQIEPTSDSTAHYTLPITHFSTWSVQASYFDGIVRFEATAQDTLTATVGTTATVPITMNGRNSVSMTAVGCLDGFVVSTTGSVSAAFPKITCSAGLAGVSGSRVRETLPLSITCTAAGDATVTSSILAFVGVDPFWTLRDDGGPLDPTTTRSLAVAMLNALATLTDDDGGATQRQMNDSGGVLIRSPLVVHVACQDAAAAQSTAPTSTTEGLGTSTTSSTVSGPTSTTRSTSTTTATTAGGSSTTSAAGGANTATSTSTSIVVGSNTSTSTSAPPTGTPSTMSTTSTASTASTMSTTSTTAPPPTTMAWGPTGAWAYNEYGTCDWNGAGACGWYYSSTPGTYTAGPPNT